MAWIKSDLREKSDKKSGKKPDSSAEAPKLRRKKAQITPEDHALWVHVTRSAKPMPGRKALDLPDMPVEPAPIIPPGDPRAPGNAPLPKARSLPPLAGIEKRLAKEVARGSRPVDSRIDLHGMRQAEAHGALVAFIHRAHLHGAKLVLVITGKGGGLDQFGEERGVLRRLVPHWLADPVLRRMVIGFEPAGRGHGGDGALYVRIRRRREQN